MADLSLATPLLLLLLPLPLLLGRSRRSLATGALELPPRLAAAARQPDRRHRGRRWRALCIWGLVVLALAGPQARRDLRDLSASGRDILLALDMSGSMLTEDFTLDGQKLSRLAAVRQVARGFVAGRRGDRVGLVLFADRAYVAAPLSLDLAAVERAIEEAQVGLTGRSTALGEGLGLALRRMTASQAKSRVIVLLSDGRDTARRLDARQVAALAAAHGVRIHTIALGPDVTEAAAARDAVDSATLAAIAAAAGGESYRVRGMADLQAMARDLDRLEPNPALRPPLVLQQPLWPWPAGAALLLALVDCALAAGLRPGRLRIRGRRWA